MQHYDIWVHLNIISRWFSGSRFSVHDAKLLALEGAMWPRKWEGRQ